MNVHVPLPGHQFLGLRVGQRCRAFERALVGAGIGTTTAPFLPDSAEWKCAAVAGPDRPVTLPFQDSCLLAVSKVAVTEPLPLLSTRGTSFEDFRSAFKLIEAASGRGEQDRSGEGGQA